MHRALSRPLGPAVLAAHSLRSLAGPERTDREHNHAELDPVLDPDRNNLLQLPHRRHHLSSPAADTGVDHHKHLDHVPGGRIWRAAHTGYRSPAAAYAAVIPRSEWCRPGRCSSEAKSILGG